MLSKIRLQRVTTSGRWIPEIDGLRFIAIAAVVIGHTANPIYQDPRFFWVNASGNAFKTFLDPLGRGVQLFFVISGFILAQPFLRQHIDGGKKVSLSSYYLRRVTRLELPYFLSLILSGLAIALIHSSKHPHIGLSIIESMLYIHNFFANPPFVNPPTWSLEIEVQFYLLAPLLALLFLIKPTWVRRAFTIAAILLCGFIPYVPLPMLQVTVAPYLCFFLAGYLIADLRVTESASRTALPWDLLAFVAWLTYFVLLPPAVPTIVLCLVVFCCFTLSMLGSRTRKILRTRWIALTGGMCYSFYLMHSIVIHGLYRFVRRGLIFPGYFLNYLAYFLMSIGPVVATSVAFYILVERPCMDPNWPRRALARVVERKAPVELEG